MVQSANPLLDAEALRVIKNMPDWKPGKNEKGEPVNVAVNLPVQFSLDDTDKKAGESK